MSNWTTCLSGRLRFCAEKLPEKINRHAGEHDHQPGPGGRCVIDEKHKKNHGGSNDVKSRHDRIPKCLVRTLGVRPFPPQQKNSDTRQNVKDERGRDYVVEQMSIEIAVSRHVSCG